MLHPIPESTRRADLMAVVEMQQQLLCALCNLEEGCTVDCAWLQGVWNTISSEWVAGFWNWAKIENNERMAHRPPWINSIASASHEKKRVIREMMAEQLRFAELYNNESAFRLTTYDWRDNVLHAVKKLLESFYDPQFYNEKGFPTIPGCTFTKDHFIDGFNPPVSICPYTDDLINDTKLDHFLPKSKFPMLSCHPDNLIPCSTDANSGSHKGQQVPLDENTVEQARNYFHPRLRPAFGKYRLTFYDTTTGQTIVQFVSNEPADQPRIDNLISMFNLSEFWSRHINKEVQFVAGEIGGILREYRIEPTAENVRTELQRRISEKRKRIGNDALAIVTSFYYEHIANSPQQINQIIRTCTFGT